MDEFDPEQTFVVSYDRIVNEKSLLGMTRLLASQMISNPYVTVGEFLKDISDGDLESLNDIIDVGEHHTNYGDLILLSEMLAAGEGLEPGNLDIATTRVNQFLIFISCESLARKGMIKVHHKNMSFGEDMANAIVAEKL